MPAPTGSLAAWAKSRPPGAHRIQDEARLLVVPVGRGRGVAELSGEAFTAVHDRLRGFPQELPALHQAW